MMTISSLDPIQLTDAQLGDEEVRCVGIRRREAQWEKPRGKLLGCDS